MQNTKFSVRQSLFYAVLLDIPLVFLFLRYIILYDAQAQDTDVEKIIVLGIVPVFIGINFFVLLLIQSILSGYWLRWVMMCSLSLVLFLVSYPAMFVGAHVVTPMNLKYPEQEQLSFWVVFGFAWVVTTIIGIVSVVVYSHSTAKNSAKQAR